MDTVMYYICMFIAVISSITLHEFAHGFVSWKLGDPTPKWERRLTLNPLRHLDPMGAICMFFFRIGWAKPVMINPRYYKKPKLGIALVGLAGPMMNVVTSMLAILAMGLMDTMAKRGGLTVTDPVYYLYYTLYLFSMVSIYQALFNLIPLPPLDGSKILAYFLPDAVMNFYAKYDRYCMIVLLVLIYFNVIDVPLDAAYNVVYEGMWRISDLIFAGFSMSAI